MTCRHLPLTADHADPMAALLTDAAGHPVTCALEVCPFCRRTVLAAHGPVPLEAETIIAAATLVLGESIDVAAYRQATNAAAVEVTPPAAAIPQRFLR